MPLNKQEKIMTSKEKNKIAMNLTAIEKEDA